MEHDVMIAGSGGQGVKLAAELLCHSGNEEGKFVLELSLYSSEMRGGQIESTVVIADQEVGTPIRDHPDTLIAMTQPLLDKFASTVRRGGTIIVNTSLAQRPDYREDCEIIEVPATDIATELGNAKAANMVMLGAYVQQLKPVKIDSLKASMTAVISEHNHRFIPTNNAALDRGAELVAG